MTDISYVNGKYLPNYLSSVNIEDRGSQFADGVYEYILCVEKNFIDLELHIDRLQTSLKALSIRMPVTRSALRVIFDRVRKLNRLESGGVYIQVSRGVAPRSHPMPKNLLPSLVVTMRRLKTPFEKIGEEGVKIKTLPDLRWKRCDIKSVSLLGNILSKTKAVETGYFDAWQVNEAGNVTEGTHNNAWMVTKGGDLLTHPETTSILSGITRYRLLSLANDLGIPVIQRPFSVEELYQAEEAFLSATSTPVCPVVQVDNQVIGSGEVGKITKRLRQAYLKYAIKKENMGEEKYACNF